MNKSVYILVLLIIILVGMGFVVYFSGDDVAVEDVGDEIVDVIDEVDEGDVIAPNDLTKVVAKGGKFSFERPSDFSLALTREQVLLSSVFVPCGQDFDYCLYFHSSEFSDTNFEGAGLRIFERLDLPTSEMCLETLPDGYSDIEPKIVSSDKYSVSLFSPIRDAGAGHYSVGNLLRLSIGTECYEFETNIRETQFENYEDGTIDKFTNEDRQIVSEKLKNILRTVKLVENDEAVFDQILVDLLE